MSSILRILLVLASVCTVAWSLRKINKAKVKMEDAIYWMFFGFVLLILAIFPQISYWLSGVMGIESPANLVFLLIICLLIGKVFMLSITVSQMDDKISVLSAELALRAHALEKEIGTLSTPERKGGERENE